MVGGQGTTKVEFVDISCTLTVVRLLAVSAFVSLL